MTILFRRKILKKFHDRDRIKDVKNLMEEKAGYY